jgi:(1->4)-alpha-D-glucan 1-alpha-D-glucosylmutase
MIRATYRLQLNANFTFRDATGLVPYLAALGISHVYVSSYLKARSGSQHGYDIVDHNAFNPEIGEEADFDEFVATLRAHGMGHIVDFVPNHMGVGKSDNAWWLDVLEWGRFSPMSPYFDIDWQSSKTALRGKVLLPTLGDTYGAVLEAGELKLVLDAEQGSFAIHYHEHVFPLTPPSYRRILEQSGLDAFGERFRALGPRAGRRARAIVLKTALAQRLAEDPEVRRAVEETVARYNGTPGEPKSFVSLHRLLEAQHYRLAHWRVAADEINYRRFFDINDLAGIRVELPELFDIVHRLVLRLASEGKLDGLRIDHIDGLFDPRGYCEKLRRVLPEGAYLVVEKILAAREELRADWPVDGTTGYDFLALIDALFADPAGEAKLRRTLAEFAGIADDFGAIADRAKRRIMESALAGEIEVLANELDRISEAGTRTRDFTLNTLREGLVEIVAALGVYRSYIDTKRRDPRDLAEIARAAACAAAERPDLAPELIEFVRDALSGATQRMVRFAMKAQQVTGPVTAKGVEDTAFYRYPLLLALNEVGADPHRFGVSVEAFHERIARDAQAWPHRMLATATHDTKRGEDARARILVLSELAEEWSDQVAGWTEINRAVKTVVNGRAAPSAADEYALYQTLIGAWPADAERIKAAIRKYAREAKRETSWARPNEPYEAALDSFVEACFAEPFAGAFAPFAQRVAQLGVANSLARTVLKLTVPGVPDIYQGAELWDLNLVDPDNRRPVDYGARAEALAALGDDPAALLGSWWDGRVKLFVSHKLLELRRERPELFSSGSYVPLSAAPNLVAFARIVPGQSLIVAAQRLSVAYAKRQDDAIVLPPDLAGVEYRAVFSASKAAAAANPHHALAEGLRAFPVCVLISVR